MLAGVSATWYTYLEQGRDIDVSAAVLDSIARALRLSEDERRHLHVLASGAPLPLGPLTGDLPGGELVRRLVGGFAGSPSPVYACDVYCDFIAWNAAAADWYEDWGGLPATERNMIRWLTTSPAARERIADWEWNVRLVAARWRAITAPLPGDDARLFRLVAEFRAGSQEFDRFWNAREVLEQRSIIRTFNHPRLGTRRMRVIVVQAPEFTPSFVVFHVPED